MPKLRHTPDGDYLPGLGRAWLMPLYDPLSRLLGAGRLHRRLLDAAGVEPGARVLEIGCGTGNLSAALVRRTPAVKVVGIDPDRAALARARRKVPDGEFRHAWAADLPLPDGAVDVVLSSLMLHHLDDPVAGLREVARVLAPGGRLHIVDFHLDPALLTAAGLTAVTETGQGRLYGRLPYRLLSATRP
ncbi:class I SAM-dependent methyltransferase [Actinoplanes couchii]|uniref:Methyltransferase type 11 domain-containing protein n=1 Tax=Actinoplanes couchii TaxID=403638 RepID=A0ABQ3XM36_9ACTN|nr:methyltransferase domain-containing protein [Actinoplanes couchii]MDR6319213.1 ubiquinone/menaquinone biosynthesis C-methylase UbiE [Actinoplanes couchii]GID59576.1 hypothetical protein Aco03nite_079800 [Actinoplanes couchii]